MRTSALLFLWTVLLGQPAPDFTLERRTGERVKLSQFRGQKRVVLVFYRGQW